MIGIFTQNIQFDDKILMFRWSFVLFIETTNKRLEEELEVYGSGLKTSVQLTSYTFEVIY